jgi:hypothetical protein
MVITGFATSLSFSHEVKNNPVVKAIAIKKILMLIILKFK